jgi:hypothetical protein
MTAPPLDKRERARLASDPVNFQQAILHRKLWKRQQDIANACATKRSTAVKGCHASGKTYVTSGCVLRHLAVFPQGKAITIAPTLRQVKLMWEEIELARRGSALQFPECSTAGLRITEERYGIGFSSAKGVNAQGFHGQDVLIITDESPGISGEVWDAIEGIRAGGRVRILKLGNPTVPSGPFFDDFGRGRAMTECITISAFDTPNLQNEKTGYPFTIEELKALSPEELEYAPAPFLVTRWWVLDKYLRWGPNNPRYLSRVLGEFPTQSEYAVFSLEWIERAKREPNEIELARAKGCFIQAGIDVAGPGDDETTAVARVNGIKVARAAWPDADPRAACAKWLHGLRSTGYELGPVVVDIVGIGYNFALHLADQGFRVVGFNAGYKPIDVEQFVNMKAEAHFRLRDMYKADYVCTLPDALDEETEAQLCGIQYRETGRGLIEIESKDDSRKRGLSSPDRAEAEIMAFCRVQPRQTGMVMQPIEQISPI